MKNVVVTKSRKIKMQKGQEKTQFLKNMQQEERKLSIQVDPQVFGLSGEKRGEGVNLGP
jgi:hypothetical protein